jgi:hypothetical protein
MRAMTLCVLICGCGSGEVDFAHGDPDEGAEGDGQNDDGIAIAGTWIDSFGITNTITSESWGWQYPGYPDMSFTITQYDNGDGVAVVQNQAEDEMGDKLWGLFEWTFVGDVPYYCQTASGLASEEEAAAHPLIDHGNVKANCNGFAWFELIPI